MDPFRVVDAKRTFLFEYIYLILVAFCAVKWCDEVFGSEMEEVAGEAAEVRTNVRSESPMRMTSATTAGVPPSLTVSASFRESGGKGSSRRRGVRPSFDADNDFVPFLHGSDPVKLELTRLENEVRGDECGPI